MSKIKLVFALAFSVALGGVSTDANALSQSAMAGHSFPNHFDSCFGSSFATMVNVCGGSPGSTRLLIIPMQAPQPGLYRASARAAGNGSGGITSCQAISIRGDNGAFNFSPLVGSNTSFVQFLDLGNMNVPSGGTLHYECFVAQGGGRVVNVELVY